MAEARSYFNCALLLLFLFAFRLLEGAVILTKDNSSLVFESADASFTPKVPSAGICGTLFSGNPINACSPLSNVLANSDQSTCLQFALVSRGDCSFDTKVRHAQDAGFQAVIIADNTENTELVTMAGNRRGISIPAVFISKGAGDVLSQYTNDSYAECWILPSYENITWLVMVISFISLIAITAVFAICFLLRQRRSHRMQNRLKESTGISYQAVKSMPSTIYQSRSDGTGSYDVCAVCLEDYEDGAMLRILPCNHRFHCSCVDAWLINWRAFCPICKRDVIKASSPPTERTPLLVSFNDAQPQATTPSLQENSPVIITTQDGCVNGISAGTPSVQQAEPCRFSFSQFPVRSSGASMRAPRPFRHVSLNSLTDQDSVEAFRASAYFTPPSSFRSSAPNVLASLESSSMDSHYIVINCGSLPEPSFFESPRTGETHLQ